MQKKNDEKILIDSIKHLLKDNDVVKQMFDDFGVDIEKIDIIPIEFAKLPVSAKTKNKKIYLNEKLLADNDFSQDIHYIVHEMCHWLQQSSEDFEKYVKQDADEYLDLQSEIEAFKYQVDFMKGVSGDDEAEQYVDDLLDFHEFDGDKRKKKKDELMGD